MVAMGMFSPYGFREHESQNAADSQAANMVPTMPGYCGLGNKNFAEMRTPEDQIHWLYLYATQLEMSTINATQAQALVDAATAALKSYVDTQDDAIKADVLQKYNYLLKLIAQLTEFPGVVFDPTNGSTVPIKSALANVYDYDRVFAVRAAEYDAVGYTAAEYDGKSVGAREYDVIFAALTYQDWAVRGNNG